MVTIRSELREVDGEAEVWTNLGDVLDWLDTLPSLTSNRIAAGAAHEIRDMLYSAVSTADVVQKTE